MADVKKHSVLVVLAAWLIIVAFFMVLNRTFDLEVFFVLLLNGLLFVVVLFDGHIPRPRYMRYINLLSAAGVVLFAWIVARKILEIITL